MANAFIVVAGEKFPWPDKESGLQTQSTLVSEGRNMYGQFIGQKIGRDLSKIELAWWRMDAGLWSRMLRIFDRDFVNPVSYYDMMAGSIITRNMYVSDRTAQPGQVDPSTGIWITAKNCKLSLVDTGG